MKKNRINQRRIKLLTACLCIVSVCKAEKPGLISDLLEQGGEFRNSTYPLVSPTPVNVYLCDRDMTGEWLLEILSSDGTYEVLDCLESHQGYCTIDPSRQTFGPFGYHWVYSKKEFDESLDRNLYNFRLTFRNKEGECERLDLKWGLAPTRPAISDVNFEIFSYDWEYDYIYPNGIFSFRIGCEDADYYYIHLTESFQFGPPFFFMTSFRAEPSSTGIMEYEADWGEFMFVGAYNKYGMSKSDTICTTDYIRDQAILDRIGELGGVDEVMDGAYGKTPSWDNRTLSFPLPVNLSVYDLTGKECFSGRDIRHVCLDFLAGGIYIAVYGNESKINKIKIIKK